MESNPLVEETRNMVAVKRGPVVYCLESADLPDANVFGVLMPANAALQPVETTIEGSRVVTLQGEAKLQQPANWQGGLYRPMNTQAKPVRIKMIPYYAWANRGKTDMTVWLPLSR
jgi:DUF1680 family protein